MVYAKGMEKHLEAGCADGEEKVNLESVLVSLFGPYESLNVSLFLTCCQGFQIPNDSYLKVF